MSMLLESYGEAAPHYDEVKYVKDGDNYTYWRVRYSKGMVANAITAYLYWDGQLVYKSATGKETSTLTKVSVDDYTYYRLDKQDYTSDKWNTGDDTYYTIARTKN